MLLGKPVTYTDWLSNEPNNCIECAGSPEGEDVAAISGDSRGTGWNDIPEGVVSLALIEVRARPTTGWISGTVTAAGSPLRKIGVDALARDPDTSGWVSAGSATTDASGAYEIGGLPPADYRIVFRGGATFVDQYWPDRSYPETASTVHLTAGGMRLGIDAALVVGGRITGRVTAGADPIADITVKADTRWQGAWIAAATARTASDGTYALLGLAPGSFRISFQDPGGRLLPEVYDNASLENPTLVNVAPGETAGGIDAALDLPGSPAPEPFIVVSKAGEIVGRGWPAGASVAVTLDDPATPLSPDLDLSAVADANGRFTLEAGSDIAAGFVATAAGGAHLRTHTVTEVQITTVDGDKDTVQGIAAPGSTVVVAVRTGGIVEPGRAVTAGADGTWVADFSVPAGTQPGDAAHDIVAGDSVSATQSDGDGDMTQTSLIVPSPEVGAPAGGFRGALSSAGGFREPGPLVPTLTTYIPTPRDISTDPPVVGANLLLAALAMIAFVVATELLNRRLGQVDPLLARRFRPIAQVDRARARLDAALIGRFGGARHARRANALRILGIAAFYGIVFALLDPAWNPLSVTGLWLVLIMAVAFGLIGLSGDIAAWVAGRRWGIAEELAVRPGSLVAAVGSTFFSRVFVLVPGVMIGSPEALEIDEDGIDRRRLGGLAGVGLGTVLAVGLVAWLATLGTTAFRGGGEIPDGLLGGVEAFLLLVFAAAVQNGFVQLLSLRKSAGLALRRTHRIIWALALLGVTFAFWHTLVNPRGNLAEALGSTNVQAFLVTVGIVLAVAVVVWTTPVVARRAVRSKRVIEGLAFATDAPTAPVAGGTASFDGAASEAPLAEAPVPEQVVPEAAIRGVVTPHAPPCARPAYSTPPAADVSIVDEAALSPPAVVPNGR